MPDDSVAGSHGSSRNELNNALALRQVASGRLRGPKLDRLQLKRASGAGKRVESLIVVSKDDDTRATGL